MAGRPTGEVTPEEVPALSWHPNGYLFVAAPDHSDQLRADFERQVGLGVEALWLEPSEVAERYPLIHTADLGPAILSPRDGWLAPSALRDGMMRRARRLGRRPRAGPGGRLRAGRPASERRGAGAGTVVRGQHIVNVAGVWGPGLSEQLGLRLPVDPMRRFDHYVESPMDFSAYPFIRDPAGLAVRPEGPGFTAALVDFSTPGGWDLSIDRDWFQNVVWLALVARVPRADELRLISTWSATTTRTAWTGR